MINIERVEKWLYATLTGNAGIASTVAGRVFRAPAPAEQPEPLIVFDQNANADSLMGSTHHVLTTADYVVRVITRGESFASAYPIAALCNDALHGRVGTADGRTMACVRVSTVSYTEVDNGIRFNHLGGLYRITISGSD